MLIRTGISAGDLVDLQELFDEEVFSEGAFQFDPSTGSWTFVSLGANTRNIARYDQKYGWVKAE